MIGGRGFRPGFVDASDGFFLRKRSIDYLTKRATDRQRFVPRSGLMISGRGFMPGFSDNTYGMPGAFYRRRRDVAMPLAPEAMELADDY